MTCQPVSYPYSVESGGHAVNPLSVESNSHVSDTYTHCTCLHILVYTWVIPRMQYIHKKIVVTFYMYVRVIGVRGYLGYYQL